MQWREFSCFVFKSVTHLCCSVQQSRYTTAHLFVTKRTRRTSAVTCLPFGAERKTRFPGYFFCHGCDLFEDAMMNGRKRRASRKQAKYQCTGCGHSWEDSSHPTTFIHGYRPNLTYGMRPAVGTTGRATAASYKQQDKNDTEKCGNSSPPSDDLLSVKTKSPLKKKMRQGRLSPSEFIDAAGIGRTEYSSR